MTNITIHRTFAGSFMTSKTNQMIIFKKKLKTFNKNLMHVKKKETNKPETIFFLIGALTPVSMSKKPINYILLC